MKTLFWMILYILLVGTAGSAWGDDGVNDFIEKAKAQISNLGKTGRAQKATEVDKIDTLLRKLDQLGLDLDEIQDSLKTADSQQKQLEWKKKEEAEKAEIQKTEEEITPLLAKLSA